MVLSGTLREFILADVLQLLTQQKITGKLILVSGRNEGYIVFKNGTIVSAVKGQEQFSMKLFYFLTEMRQQSKTKVREVFSSYEGNLAELTSFIEKKGFLSLVELQSYATNVTIDITCSLFLWTTGNYRFDSMPSVDHLIPAGIDIPVENVLMEAMRRIDEWHRMREMISEDTIFVHTDQEFDMQVDRDPITDPSLYFYHRINGTTEVKILLQDSFLTEYKIYETLHEMVQNELIKPLSDTVTRSIRAAMLKKEQEQTTAPMLPPIIAISVTIGIILLIILLAWLFRGILFSKLTIDSSILKSQITNQTADTHFRDARIFYQSTTRSTGYTTNDVLHFSSISQKDAAYLALKRNLENSNTREYNKLKH
jgi:hypothetical protein